MSREIEGEFGRVEESGEEVAGHLKEGQVETGLDEQSESLEAEKLASFLAYRPVLFKHLEGILNEEEIAELNNSNTLLRASWIIGKAYHRVDDITLKQKLTLEHKILRLMHTEFMNFDGVNFILSKSQTSDSIYRTRNRMDAIFIHGPGGETQENLEILDNPTEKNHKISPTKRLQYALLGYMKACKIPILDEEGNVFDGNIVNYVLDTNNLVQNYKQTLLQVIEDGSALEEFSQSELAKMSSMRTIKTVSQESTALLNKLLDQGKDKNSPEYHSNLETAKKIAFIRIGEVAKRYGFLENTDDRKIILHKSKIGLTRGVNFLQRTRILESCYPDIHTHPDRVRMFLIDFLNDLKNQGYDLIDNQEREIDLENNNLFDSLYYINLSEQGEKNLAKKLEDVLIDKGAIRVNPSRNRQKIPADAIEAYKDPNGILFALNEEGFYEKMGGLLSGKNRRSLQNHSLATRVANLVKAPNSQAFNDAMLFRRSDFGFISFVPKKFSLGNNPKSPMLDGVNYYFPTNFDLNDSDRSIDKNIQLTEDDSIVKISDEYAMVIVGSGTKRNVLQLRLLGETKARHMSAPETLSRLTVWNPATILPRYENESEDHHCLRVANFYDPNFFINSCREIYDLSSIDIRSCSLREQLNFMNFYAVCEDEDKQELMRHLGDFREPFVKAFQVCEYDLELGNKILSVAADYEPLEAQKVFEKLIKVTDLVNQNTNITHNTVVMQRVKELIYSVVENSANLNDEKFNIEVIRLGAEFAASSTVTVKKPREAEEINKMSEVVNVTTFSGREDAVKSGRRRAMLKCLVKFCYRHRNIIFATSSHN